MILAIILSIEDDADRNYLLSIYKEYYPLMKAKAYQIVNDHSSAEDIVQDAVIKLIPHLAKLRTLKTSFALSYICNTIRTLSIDYYRKNKSRESKAVFWDEDDHLMDIADEEPTIEDRYERIENISAMGEVIMKMSKKDQDLLYYKYNLNYDDKQIGELLGMTYGNVRVALNRAKARAKRLLIERGGWH